MARGVYERKPKEAEAKAPASARRKGPLGLKAKPMVSPPGLPVVPKPTAFAPVMGKRKRKDGPRLMLRPLPTSF